MAHNPKLTNLAANSSADAVCAHLNSGFLKGYDGTQPATGDTALSGNTLLFTCGYGSTAFGSASSGVATANSISDDSSADASGTCTFMRNLKTDGTTKVFDGSAGSSGCDLNLSNPTIVSGGVVSITAATYTQNKG